MPPNDTESLSPNQWRELILARRKGKGRIRYYSAICPICLVCYDVDILSSDASAHAIAVEKVASHIINAHSSAVS